MGEVGLFSYLFEQTDMVGDSPPEDLFSILETFEDAVSGSKERAPFGPKTTTLVASQVIGSRSRTLEVGADERHASKKRRKLDSPAAEDPGSQDGQQKTSHITVERNRRKQMNEHLSVLRSLMPCFYAKRGDQASIIGGVVDYIKELQQVLHSLKAKKQRKAYSEAISPRPVCSSPRPPPPSPRMALPISPKTPQPAESSPSFSSVVATTAANSKSAVAEVVVKFSGPNVILKTVSHRIPGQALKIIAALEGLAMEILHVSISTNVNEDTVLNSFTIKIGIECELSAEELAQEIQQTFL
ncbi:transcription factor SPEECHLESS-like isoform X2 [Zingiber officinale]|uniref:transcription factor SPEECHLESS-like isoform X2 n=1 Tax=Zingiber officinale TaxID=94328 RepID=UPI001C4BB709|nr:transcription factor SPEECHLESS-like isoform X2 [Zingiber officinale]